ncbi:MAG: hypothetical protein K0S27_1155 [Gammaproteobacteria bacterium]|jgi:hypothetical protein|nr:hypothetical protein [Gammaproteobacteria bacterium]
MGHALNFDTLAYANKLKQSGVPDKQAEAQSEALAEIFDYQTATKKDLQEVEGKLNVKIHEVETKLSVKILEIKTDLIQWIIALLFAQSAILLFSFLKFFR